MVAGTGRRCLVVIIGGASPPLSDSAFQQVPLEVTEETFGWPISASRAIAASATGDGRVASVGLATAAPWW